MEFEDTTQGEKLVMEGMQGFFLHTKIRLRDKGVNMEPLCDLCSVGLESSWHLFMQCAFALSC